MVSWTVRTILCSRNPHRVIAELVGSRHDNVKRTIESLVEQGVISFPQIEEKPTAGRPLQFYVFEGEQGKRDSIVVVAQPHWYVSKADEIVAIVQRNFVSAILRARITNRFRGTASR